MTATTRAKRMARNHRRMAQPARLNLVALMDIFTILVLFLIVNNSDVEVLQPDRRIAFSVPTGNFGDVFAGYVASRMGLPVDQLVIATNANVCTRMKPRAALANQDIAGNDLFTAEEFYA